MPTNVVVPNLGPSIEEAVLVRWLVSEGEFVRRGTPLFSVETDKTVVDCEAVADGYLTRVAASEGATVRVDEVLAVLAEGLVAGERPAELVPTPVVQVGQVGSATGHDEKQPPPDQRHPGVAAAAEVLAMAPVPSAAELRRPAVSPRARRMARDLGVEATALRGSGPGGRVVQRDVQALISAALSGTSATHAAAVSESASAHRARDVPLSPMRRAIARRMVESAREVPVFHATCKIDFDALLEIREQLKKGSGLDVTVTDIVVKACAHALLREPAMNATFHGDFVRVHEQIHVAVAVALEDGLVTPVIRDVARRPLREVSGELRELAGRARAGRLARADLDGGTITISNLGMYGVESFTAIINPPQCAILSVGAIEREVVLDAGVARVRRVARVTLGADHRAVDGAHAARFLAALRNALENPASLLV